MINRKWLSILTAAALTASQIAVPAFGATDVNGQVWVNGDSASASTSEGSLELGQESGSIINTDGDAALTVTDTTGEAEGKASTSFTVTGDIQSDNSRIQAGEEGTYDSGYVAGMYVMIQDPDGEVSSVQNTGVEVFGNVTGEGQKPANGQINGLDIYVSGGINKDQSLDVNIGGDVKAENTSTGYNSAVGVNLYSFTEQYEEDDPGLWEDEGEDEPYDPGYEEDPGDGETYDSGEDEGAGEDEPYDPDTEGAEGGSKDQDPQAGTAAVHSMTTNVSAGSVTADGGKEGDADGVWINSDSITASENMTVDIRGDVSAKTENGASTGVYADVRGANDNAVTVTVGGNVSAEGKGGTVRGINVEDVTSDEGEASARIEIKGDVKAANTDPEYRAEGITIGTYISGDLDINIGGDVIAEGVADTAGILSYMESDGSGTIKVAGNVSASATGTGAEAAAIDHYEGLSGSSADILVGGDVKASGAESRGILLEADVIEDEEEAADEEGETSGNAGNADASQKVPGRIEVLGTVDGGANGADLLIRVYDAAGYIELNEKTGEWEKFIESDPMAASEVKSTLETILPEVITHELSNGSIKAESFGESTDNEKAALEVLKDKVFYTVNYSTKVVDEKGAEDDTLGTITITKYDGKDLATKELRYDGSTVCVAKAGDVIKINIKVGKEAVSEDKKTEVEGEAVVTTEETDTQIITTTTTPVTTTTWTETVSYELDLDKLQIGGGKGILKAEKTGSGEAVYTLEVTPTGGIDIDVEALIKAITEKSNLQKITKKVVKVIKKDKPAGSDDTKPDNTKPDDTKPDDTKPDDAKPDDTKPDNTKPDNDKEYGGTPSSGRSSNNGSEWTAGWFQENGFWYYRTSTGSLMRNTWGYLPWGDQTFWYYFDLSGHMLTGWQQISGKWYYLEPQKGQNQGHLFVDGMTPDGYRVDANGAWIV